VEPIHVPWTPTAGKFARGLPVKDRIIYRLAKAGIDLDPEKCWPWPGARSKAGYGRIASDPEGDTYVHRIMFRECVGPIPDGAEVDHRCHNDDPHCVDGDDCLHRPCANPGHLEATTRPENARRRRLDVRGVKCTTGHLWEPHRNGQRGCRQCYNDYMREYNRAYRAKRKAEGRPLQ